MSIQVKNLSKIYGQQKAVDRISFEIQTGSIVGFLGPNGAGKSTTMKLIAGYLPPNEGGGHVAGIDFVEQSLEVRKILGYLPENNPLYPEMYIKEFLLFVAGLSGVNNALKAVEHAIEITQLGPERHKKIGQLSKGYRQRVGLAQALLHDPKVLILDEPTSGLDPIQVGEMRNVIISLGKEKTVLLSTHIMQEVEAMCERVIMIHKGKIVADDPLEKLKSEHSVSLEDIFKKLTQNVELI